MDLSDRQKETLRLVVEAFIENGEPVGSKYLTQPGLLPWSPATVRNDMMELERCGLLSQPHTSAGRIPTDLGYRAYVNGLMDAYKMTVEEINTINRLLSYKVSELDKIVANVGKIASHLSSYTAVTMAPKPSGATITRFETVSLDSKNIVIILMTSANLVKSRHIRTVFDVDDAIVRRFGTVLNKYFTGADAESITLRRITEAERELGEYASLLPPTLRIINETISDAADCEIQLDGVTNLLKYPEFSDEGLRDIINLTENKDELAKLLLSGDGGAVTAGDGIHVIIGGSDDEPMHDCSIVYKTFGAGRGLTGAIGIIGPKRMDYGRVIAHIDCYARHISGFLDDGGAEPGHDGNKGKDKKNE